MDALRFWLIMRVILVLADLSVRVTKLTPRRTHLANTWLWRYVVWTLSKTDEMQNNAKRYELLIDDFDVTLNNKSHNMNEK